MKTAPEFFTAQYLIQFELDEVVYWSNAWGWVDLLNADRFSQFERDTLPLRMGGKWVDLAETLRGSVVNFVG